jgi:hypothetical protein
VPPGIEVIGTGDRQLPPTGRRFGDALAGRRLLQRGGQIGIALHVEDRHWSALGEAAAVLVAETERDPTRARPSAVRKSTASPTTMFGTTSARQRASRS